MDMQNLIEMLKRHEGEVVTNGRHLLYKCSAGHWTIGIGRNVDVNGGLGLSGEEVDFLLEKDIERVIKELSSEYRWFADLDDVRKDAMIDISFNLGATKLRKFVLALDAMDRADYITASEEFLDSNWSRTVKGRSVELASMIATGEYSE
jgi:GH24 family phage-related lysozyme (muramidase)|tara:strand:- start:142 stop:588 length:447 start_codon:yes stop_codon:yes gene_type:complete